MNETDSNCYIRAEEAEMSFFYFYQKMSSSLTLKRPNHPGPGLVAGGDRWQGRNILLEILIPWAADAEGKGGACLS